MDPVIFLFLNAEMAAANEARDQNVRNTGGRKEEGLEEIKRRQIGKLRARTVPITWWDRCPRRIIIPTIC